MPVGFPSSPFLGSAMFDQPATLTPSGGTARDIDIVLERNYQDTDIGDAQVTNGRPVAYAAEADVQDVTSGATLTVHEYLLDDNEQSMVADDGTLLVADNAVTYSVIRVRRTGDGMAEIDLRLD